jgi:predicted GNAT family acetyltransferase
MNVRHDAAKKAFLADVEGGTAELTYSEKDGVVDFNHTWVPEEAGGKGVGAALAKTGLAWARAQKRKVALSCTFMDSYVKKHREEYADLLA